jgi:hypothetical protein
MWHLALVAFLFCASVFGADSPAVDVPWEPWAAKAKPGDFVVRKCSGGVTIRSEVTKVNADLVAVAETTDVDGVKSVQNKHYLQKKKPYAGANPVGLEVDVKPTDQVEVTVGGKVVKAQKYSGFMVTGYAHTGKTENARKLAKYEKIIADSVPFGGMLKEFIAEEDGVALKPGGGKQVNKNEKLELLTEVVAFGNVNDEKSSSK